MRPVVIVLPHIAADVFSGLVQVPILREPDFLLPQAAMQPLDVAVALRVMKAVRRYVIPSRTNVFVNRAEVNWVPLSVVSVKLASRLPAGRRSSTACLTAVKASSVRQRCERFEPRIFRVQQSITETR